MTGLAHREELAVLRECQARRLDREGIPMILVLSDERASPASGDAKVDVDAETAPDRHGSRRVLELLETYRVALAPTQRDGDMGLVGNLLHVVAYVDVTEALLP